MAKKSKLKKCRYCGQEIHARGMASHIAFKHANSQVPPPIENPSTQPIETPLTKNDYSATPSRELITATQKHEDLEIQSKPQLSIRSAPAESDKGKDSGVTMPSETPAKPIKINWGLVVLVGLVLWSIPQVRESLQRHWRGETYTRKQRV